MVNLKSKIVKLITLLGVRTTVNEFGFVRQPLLSEIWVYSFLSKKEKVKLKKNKDEFFKLFIYKVYGLHYQ